jgi:hypothetical protein
MDTNRIQTNRNQLKLITGPFLLPLGNRITLLC